MANVPELSNYVQTTVTTPTQPSEDSMFDLKVMRPLIRELTVKQIIEEPTLQAEIDSARSFFKGNTVFHTDELVNDLKFGQELRINIEKDQNPLSLYQTETIGYDAVDGCHNQIDEPISDCSVPCINTLPTFEHVTFRFDTEYAYGVRACDKNKDFYDFGYFTKQYAKSKRAEQFGRELDLWNTVIKGLIAAPAQTVDAKIAAKYPTHYWADLGTVTAMARATVGQAVRYMRNSYNNLSLTTFMAEEAANEIIKSEDALAPYSVNLTNQRVNTFQTWDFPGFDLSEHVRDILGLSADVPTVIMKRSPWLTVGGESGLTSRYPLWSEDTTKQYIAILDPRVGYQVAKDGYHLIINPYDCDKLVRGMIDTEYVGSGITFPQYGLILEYTASEIA